ncbi:MAG: glycosyl transferase family 1, partial [Marinobacter sp.]|nr:glycosyl transferase family 1 [Marinobacter sp.]
QRIGALDVPVQTSAVQLTPENIGQYLPRDMALITASALIDLVSERWLNALIEVATASRAAVLIVLSYAGHFELTPRHPDDALLQELVNRHQHGDKGTGAALGPEASGVLQRGLAVRGYEVELAESRWHLDARDADLVQMLMAGWVEAAIEQAPERRSQLSAWRETRKGQLAKGDLLVSVDHLDLLALPPEAMPCPS